MKKRPFILLPIILVLLLGSIFILPQRGESAGSAVEIGSRQMDLPLLVGSWQGMTRAETPDERRILSADTRFAKAEYTRQRGSIIPFYDRISASIVLSGSDLNNSIHRPERCLPAQGHFNLKSSSFRLQLDDGHEIPVRRLRTQIKLGGRSVSSEKELDEGREAGSSIKGRVVKTLTYYFFIGNDSITHSHYQRTLIDMQDRLLFGRDQRWAYLQIGIHYDDPELGFHLSEEGADEAARNLLKQLVPRIVNWDQIDWIDPGV